LINASGGIKAVKEFYMKKLTLFFVLAMIFSVLCQAQSGNRPDVYQSFSRGYFIDKKLHGTWAKESRSEFQIVFYANTWLAIENNARIGSGVFIMDNDTIVCFFTTWERNEKGTFDDKFNVFEMDYVLQPNSLTISNMNDSFNGKWKRINTPQPPRGNPVVGIWKAFEFDCVFIYQFYADGTGVFHMYDPESGVLYKSDNFNYNLNTLRIEPYNTTTCGFIIEGGKLFFTGPGYRSPPYDKL
jgi:hypothetical protein